MPDDHCEIVVGGGGGKLGACPVFDISDMGDRLQLPADAPGVLPKPPFCRLHSKCASEDFFAERGC